MTISFNVNENSQMEREEMMSWEREGTFVAMMLSWEWGPSAQPEDLVLAGAWVIDTHLQRETKV